MLKIRRLNNLIAISGSENSYIGFHMNNLEIAKLSKESWDSMKNYEFQASYIPELMPFAIDASKSETHNFTGLNSNDALQELIAWNQEVNSEVQTGPAPNRINHITINVTQVCNLHCTYCAAGGDGSFGDPIKKISIERTLPQVDFFLNKAPEGSNFKLNFLGGEPLLYPQAISMICDYANEIAKSRNIQMHYSIVTNGTLLTPANIELLRKNKMDVTISFDGAPENHDQFRKTVSGKGSSHSILKGVSELLNSKETAPEEFGAIGMSAVFSRNNLELVSAYKFFSSLKLDWYDFIFEYSERDLDINNQYLSSLEEVAKLAYEKGGEKELRRIKFFKHYFDQIDSQIRVENHCGAGKSYLSIDARNRVFSCHWDINQPGEEVKDFANLSAPRADEKDLNPVKSKDSLIEKHNCHTCWAKYICGGGCMYINKLNTGKKSTKDELFCLRMRYTLAIVLFYYYKLRMSLTAQESLGGSV